MEGLCFTSRIKYLSGLASGAQVAFQFFRQLLNIFKIHNKLIYIQSKQMPRKSRILRSTDLKTSQLDSPSIQKNFVNFALPFRIKQFLQYQDYETLRIKTLEITTISPHQKTKLTEQKSNKPFVKSVSKRSTKQKVDFRQSKQKKEESKKESESLSKSQQIQVQNIVSNKKFVDFNLILDQFIQNQKNQLIFQQTKNRNRQSIVQVSQISNLLILVTRDLNGNYQSHEFELKKPS